MIDVTPGRMLYEYFISFQTNLVPWSDLISQEREAWESTAEYAQSNPTWLKANFDDRQQKQIEFSRVYARDFHHGADGHNSMMIIAKMADLLDGKG